MEVHIGHNILAVTIVGILGEHIGVSPFSTYIFAVYYMLHVAVLQRIMRAYMHAVYMSNKHI